MANYTIIGGDGKEYGLISEADIRKWISEGRLNAQSLAKAESDAEFRALEKFPEFAGVFATQTAAPGAPSALATSANLLGRDYDLDIGGCISRGWKLFWDNFGTLFGAFIVVGLLGGIGVFFINTVLTLMVPKEILASPVLRQFFNVILQAGIAVIIGPFFGGVYYVFIQKVRSRPASVGDIFIGFQNAFSQLFLGHFVVGLFVGLCMSPFNIAFASKLDPFTEKLQHASQADLQSILPQMEQAFSGALPLLLVCMIPVTYLTVNWMFALPLIIDKRMDFWTAMKTSWKKVHQHWWYLFGFVVVIGLLNLAGVCACCIGVLFTLPIGTAASMFAYETIFGESQTR